MVKFTASKGALNLGLLGGCVVTAFGVPVSQLVAGQPVSQQQWFGAFLSCVLGALAGNVELAKRKAPGANNG